MVTGRVLGQSEGFPVPDTQIIDIGITTRHTSPKCIYEKPPVLSHDPDILVTTTLDLRSDPHLDPKQGVLLSQPRKTLLVVDLSRT